MISPWYHQVPSHIHPFTKSRRRYPYQDSGNNWRWQWTPPRSKSGRTPASRSKRQSKSWHSQSWGHFLQLSKSISDQAFKIRLLRRLLRLTLTAPWLWLPPKSKCGGHAWSYYPSRYVHVTFPPTLDVLSVRLVSHLILSFLAYEYWILFSWNYDSVGTIYQAKY